MSFYDLFKKLSQSILPKSFLIKHELKFRYLSYLNYRGNSFECVICKSNLKSFIANENRSCPRCGSIARERRLWKLLNSEEIKSKSKILDFSPSRSIYREMKKIKGSNYLGTDLSGNFLADRSFDITKIDAESNSFDLIICYHILEHIVDDLQAISELYRILGHNGICIIQTPFKDGGVYEDYSITSPEARLKAFGQDDHVRIYSVDELSKRLTEKGFKVRKLTFKEERNNQFGFKIDETILICSK